MTFGDELTGVPNTLLTLVVVEARLDLQDEGERERIELGRVEELIKIGQRKAAGLWRGATLIHRS